MSEELAKIIRKKGFRVVMQPKRKVKSYFPNIYDGDRWEKPGVYRIKCGGCGRAYIGETGRQMKTRRSEHVKYLQYERMSSALVEHSTVTRHGIDISSMDVIANISGLRERKI